MPSAPPPLLLATVVALGVAASPAAADSIVYAKDGNLFLTSPDGSKGYQLTTDGGYSSPSQADDGTIGALRYDQLVRLDRSGRCSTRRSTAWARARARSAARTSRASPDGTRFAYYFYVQSSYDDYANDIRWIDTGSYTTWTYADRFTNPATESEYERSMTQPEWVTNDRLLGTLGFYLNMWTWKLGTGHGYTYPGAQWWFGLRDPVDEWGVAAYHWYDDPALSRDGSRLAMTDSGQQLVVASTHGPAWSGEPPYRRGRLRRPAAGPAAADDRLPRPRGQDREPELGARRLRRRLRHARRRARDDHARLRRPAARPGRLRAGVRARRRRHEPGAQAPRARRAGAPRRRAARHLQALAAPAALQGPPRHRRPLHARGAAPA